MDLSGIPLIDQHAHNVVRSPIMDATPYPAAFTEGYAPDIIHHHARHTLCYRRSLRDLGALLHCDPTEEAIVARRSELGLDALTQLCMQAAHLESILLDDGFLPDQILPLEWHQRFVPTYRLLRIESLAEQMMQEVNHFDVFLEWFRSELESPPPEVVGLKSIAAYRTGLDLQPVAWEDAADRFYAIKELYPDSAIRLSDPILISFLVYQALDIASHHPLPLQFHTGYGDPDLDLRLANPLHLRPILEDSRYQQVPIILLHGAYPFMAEAAYLASVYPQVYIDFGLAVPFLSVAGMKRTVQHLLELSPTTKVMYSSDAHLIPELYYLGALWGRRMLGEVLEDAIQSGDLSSQEADQGAIAILHQTARSLYRLTESAA